MPRSPKKKKQAADRETALMAMYQAMLEALGPSHWWPGDSPFEVAVGTILTQNTAWRNVEKALDLLRAKEALTPAGLWHLPGPELEEALRPSGYFRVKADRLRGLLAWLTAFPGWDGPSAASLDFVGGLPTADLRESLLGVRGIGPETADAIVLYAFSRPSFVVDAYTRRIFSRHGHVPEQISYEALRAYFMEALPVDAPLYNEYHALIVRIGNTYCKKRKPLCAQCPLGGFLKREAAKNPA